MDIAGIVTAILMFALGVWKYNDEKKKRNLEIRNLELANESLERENKDYKLKLQFYNKIMDLPFINAISGAVDEIFKETIATRFLILIAKNGKEDFNVVSVVFEQHKNKDYRINAIARYKNVLVDNEYRKMLKNAERFGVVEFEVNTMPQSLLRTFYEMEGVKFSKIRHLARKPIDDDNDFLVFSSLATHEDRYFNDQELAFVKTQFEGTIMPALQNIMD